MTSPSVVENSYQQYRGKAKTATEMQGLLFPIYLYQRLIFLCHIRLLVGYRCLRVLPMTLKLVQAWPFALSPQRLLWMQERLDIYDTIGCTLCCTAVVPLRVQAFWEITYSAWLWLSILCCASVSYEDDEETIPSGKVNCGHSMSLTLLHFLIAFMLMLETKFCFMRTLTIDHDLCFDQNSANIVEDSRLVVSAVCSVAFDNLQRHTLHCWFFLGSVMLSKISSLVRSKDGTGSGLLSRSLWHTL